jgi:putative acetyltransferase
VTDPDRIRFELDPLTAPVVRELIATHLQLMRSLSPPQAVHALEVASLQSPMVRFWSAWIDGELVGGGALKRIGASEGELKSMHVRAAFRRLRLGAKILAHLEDDARSNGIVRLSLETGAQDAFAPARRFYETFGYTQCGPFGDHTESPHSAFMTKQLDRAET